MLKQRERRPRKNHDCEAPKDTDGALFLGLLAGAAGLPDSKHASNEINVLGSRFSRCE